MTEMNPQSLKYSKTDEWIAVEGEIATVGITDLAVQALTDLVFIELPAKGKRVELGKTFGVVESVKAASDLYSPVTGEVVESNGKVANDLGMLSSDPFGAGWLMKVKLSAPLPADLLTRAEYEAHFKQHH